MIGIKEDRPPYVKFDRQAVEDREATIAAGHYVAKDVDVVMITPQGSKDCVIRNVPEWFAKLEQDAREGRLPSEWLAGYRKAYDLWREGQEMPLEGTPITNWAALSPAQVKTLLAVNVRTVEDVAGANEETIQRMGMGGRALKQRAEEYLRTANDVGKTSERVAALQVENADLKQRNESLESRLKALEAKLEASLKK